jgi:rhamnogalacturonyl hydrolase YesR
MWMVLMMLMVVGRVLATSPAISPMGKGLPSRAEILAAMNKVNDWQSAHPVMKPNDRNWERGTWYTGVMAAYKATGEKKFLEQALAWGSQHAWQVGTEKCGGNRLFCVQTWLETYFVQKDRAMIAPALQWLETQAPNSPAGARRWYLEGDHSYADSLYGASALAMLARATGDPKYLATMHAFFWDVADELYDKDDHLFYRDNRFIGKQTAAGKKVLWSRGNGWVLGGLARILEYLPETDPQRPRYVKLFQELSAAIASRQGDDGLWRPNLADSADQPMPETSGTGFFCYGLAWGVNHGLLDRATYLPVIQKAWGGLVSSLTPEGKVQWGQQVDSRPNALKQESTHEYVTGTFLLAASEVYKLAQ